MRIQETYKPEMSPYNKKYKMTKERDYLNRKEYSDTLHKRSKEKQHKLKLLK